MIAKAVGLRGTVSVTSHYGNRVTIVASDNSSIQVAVISINSRGNANVLYAENMTGYSSQPQWKVSRN